MNKIDEKEEESFLEVISKVQVFRSTKWPHIQLLSDLIRKKSGRRHWICGPCSA